VAASIDVVVAVHNGYALTCDCLSHLRRQTVPHRVIVVDDGSDDGTAALVRRDWPEATLVQLEFNQGYTRAVNRGVSEGEGEFVVLLNNDVRLRPDCLERLVAPLGRDPRVGSVAALMLMPGERRIDSLGVTADVTLAGYARLQGHDVDEALAAASATMRTPQPTGPPSPARSRSRAMPPQRTPQSTGRSGRARSRAATMRAPVLAGPEGTAGAYRRGAWEQVGGLDETISAYMEILDLALRLRAAGWQAACARDARGMHLGSSTYGKRSPRQRRLAGFSRGYLLRRYGVLRGRAGARALFTEAAVVAGDLVLCRDLEALRGRLEGWRAGAGLPRHPPPPPEAIDSSISLWRSLKLRRAAVAGRAV
jgi:GT2 family glycosyltransferase